MMWLAESPANQCISAVSPALPACCVYNGAACLTPLASWLGLMTALWCMRQVCHIPSLLAPHQHYTKLCLSEGYRCGHDGLHTKSCTPA